MKVISETRYVREEVINLRFYSELINVAFKNNVQFFFRIYKNHDKIAKIKTPPLKCSLATQNVSIQQLFWPDHRKQASIIIDSVMNKYWY
jgi:hypothetical protein